MKKIKGILYRRNSVLNILTACAGCASKIHSAAILILLTVTKTFFFRLRSAVLSFSTWHVADKSNMPTPPNSAVIEWIFYFSYLSSPLISFFPSNTSELSSVTAHQQTCPSPTPCDIFIAMSSDAGSSHQGFPGWRSQRDGSNCYFQTAQATFSVPGNPRASVSKRNNSNLRQRTCSKKLKNMNQGQILRPIIQANSF